MGEIIALNDKDDDEVKPGSDEDNKKDDLLSNKEKSNIKDESIQRTIANTPLTQAAPSAKTIKDEPIDLDNDDDLVVIVSKAEKSVSSVAPKQNEAKLSDEELLKKERAALQKLEEEIAHEEKLYKMKRERDAIRERINAASSSSSKRIKTE